MLRQLERKIRSYRYQVFGRRPKSVECASNNESSTGRTYWRASHLVCSIVGDGRMRVTQVPHTEAIVVEDSRTGVSVRLVEDRTQGAVAVEQANGPSWVTLAVYQRNWDAAILHAIRTLLAAADLARPDDGAAGRWGEFSGGQKPWPRLIRFGPQWTTRLHRGGWGYALEPLRALENPQGVLFDGFLEATFCWRETGIVYDKPWIGVIHNPPDTPPWAGNGASTNDDLFACEQWKQSRRHCRGLFVLSNQHRKALRKRVAVPVSVLTHPTETPQRLFSFRAFRRNPEPMLIQVGNWLRNPNSLYKLRVTRLTKARLDVGHPWEEDARMHLPPGPLDRASVKLLPRASDAEYDELLSKNLVFLDLLAASANNAIVECIVRNTPVLVNPLPAVVEYLGRGYPFYYRDLEEAARKAEDPNCARRAHDYLEALPKERFSQEGFRKQFVESEVYRSLDRRAERILLMAQPRSGSKSLMTILNAHEEFEVAQEPFNPKRDTWGQDARQWHNYHRDVSDIPSLDDALDQLFATYTGMKHLFGQLPWELDEHLLGRATHRILLYRRNVLQAVASAMIAQQTQVWHGDRDKVPNQALEALDVEKVAGWLAHQQKQIHRFREFLFARRLPFLEVAYEELFDERLSPDEKLAKVLEIFRYCGVSELSADAVARVREQLDPEKYKLNSAETYRRIPNVDEIDACLASAENGFLLTPPTERQRARRVA